MRCRWASIAFLAMAVAASAAETEMDGDQKAGITAQGEVELAPVAVRLFHEQRSDRPVWADDAAFDALLSALEGLFAHGLNPEHYHYSTLKRIREDHAARDLLGTDAWFSAASHMIYGKLDPLTMEPDWTAARRKADLSAILNEALRDGTVAGSLSALAPKQPEYTVLMAELHRIRTLMAMLLEPVGLPQTLKSGKKREAQAAKRAGQVRTLQSWLVQLGRLGSTNVTGEIDEATFSALTGLQAEAGLRPSGNADSETVAALRRLLQGQADQVRVNLERWRWLPDDLGRRHVRANIAGFSVTTYEDSQPVRTHPAIVGKLYRRTPVFSDAIRYIVFNPWWETPPSLASSDQLDLFIRDPAAVTRMGFQVLDGSGRMVDPDTVDWTRLSATRFPYRLRQAPGPQNPLGRVKIMFPNPHNVYLHDTPLQGLFAERQRAFSSGCLRTQYPIELAEWLLAETPGWRREAIDRSLAGGVQVRVDLAAKVPVHILYLTVTAEHAGSVRYLDDIYDRDTNVLNGLNEKAAGPA